MQEGFMLFPPHTGQLPSSATALDCSGNGHLYWFFWDLCFQLKGNLVAFVEGGQSFTYFLNWCFSPDHRSAL